MIFDSVRASFLSDQPELKNKNTPFSYKIQFLKNNTVSELFTNDKEIFEEWKSILSSKCVLNTFHNEYQVSKMIGKGSFAKV